MTRTDTPLGRAAASATAAEDVAPARQLAGKVAVVTGSTQGLGLAAVETMLRRGLAGAVICGRNAEAGAAAAERLTREGRRVVFQPADLAKLEDCHAVIDRALEAFGTLDILVNSAGVTDRGGILDGDAALWQRTFDVNARAPFFLMQRTAQHLREAGKPGAIVNIATASAHGGQSFLTVYAASKAALVAMTKNAAFSLLRDGIRVNALAIGWMDTPGEDVIQRRFHDRPEGWQEAAGRSLPAGRMLDMNEVARWIVHLASPESGIMSGSIIDFDHGVLGCADATPLPMES